MTYEIIDMDGGDVVAVFGSLESASAQALELAAAHPEMTGDIAVISIDDEGHRVGDPLFADRLHLSA